jgi:hypothetical protein
MMPEVIHIVNGGGRVLCFGLAPVASLRCRTLRPGEVSINRCTYKEYSGSKKLAGTVKDRIKTRCPGCAQLAGFEVTTTGRF